MRSLLRHFNDIGFCSLIQYATVSISGGKKPNLRHSKTLQANNCKASDLFCYDNGKNAVADGNREPGSTFGRMIAE